MPYLSQKVTTVSLKEELLIIKSGVVAFPVHSAGGVALALSALPLSRLACAVNQRQWVSVSHSESQSMTRTSDKKMGRSRSPGVALLADFLSRGVKHVVVLAGTLLPLDAAPPAVVQQAPGTHAARLALLKGLRGRTTA